MSHPYEDRSSESTFRDSRSHSQDNPEPPDLPMPTCFRSRSHSYLRAIQAGCSQDDDTASMDSGCSPPPNDPTVRTYTTSTGEYFHEKQMTQFPEYLCLFFYIKKYVKKVISHLIKRETKLLHIIQCTNLLWLSSELNDW